MIRPATEHDIPALMGLLEQILAVHHQARPDLFKALGQKFSPDDLRNLLADDSRPIFVYQGPDGSVLGHLFLHIQVMDDHPVLKANTTLFIEDLCVAQEARGQGIGEQLYDFAVAHARTIGAHNLTLDAWVANAGAHRFYERLGLTPMKTIFELRL